MKNKIKIIFPLILMAVAFIPSVAFASLKYSGYDNSSARNTYSFTGSETFTGYLEYDDCGKNEDPFMLRTGCPSGYNFIIREQKQLNKIPLAKKTLKKFLSCPDKNCELFIMLGDTDQYAATENDTLKRLMANPGESVTLSLQDLSIGNYANARYTEKPTTPPSRLAASGPELALLLPVTFAIMCLKRLFRLRNQPIS